MIDFIHFLYYLIVIAGTTYLIRMLPLVLVKKKITNSFVKSFLYYVPYAVLGVMTFPAVFYSTSNIISSAIGTITAIILAYYEKSLLVVSAAASAAVLIAECIIKYAV